MRNLLRLPSGTLPRDLESAMRAIIAATPLSRAHEQELPYAVRDLSRLLTQERSLLRESYWINKRFLTAYCRYFLPWNLCRLSWLLPGLDIPLRAGDTVLDLGSGPLTVPLALWLAKPEWRELPLHIVCGDIAPGPLNAGREIFRVMACDSPWTIELKRGPLEKTLREFSGSAALITAGNVLNEIKPPRQMPLRDGLARLLRGMASRLTAEGRILAVEPGTRLGGKLIALARQVAFEFRLVPEAPCPHWGPCPMQAEHATGWCHFTHTTQTAPPALLGLARKAGFDKRSLSLSCLLLRRANEDEARLAAAHLPVLEDDGEFGYFFDDGRSAGPGCAIPGGSSPDEAETAEPFWAEAFAAIGTDQALIRILSDPIRLPDAAEPARYGCSRRGLVLVHDALRLPSGAGINARWPKTETRDAKTGALELFPADRGGQAAGERQPGSRESLAPGELQGQDRRERTSREENRRGQNRQERNKQERDQPEQPPRPRKPGGKGEKFPSGSGGESAPQRKNEGLPRPERPRSPRNEKKPKRRPS